MKEIALQIPGSNIIYRGPDSLDPRFNTNTFTFGFFVSDILPVVFLIMSFLAFIWIVWGAFQWIFSQGDKNAIAKARQRITYALVGLALMLISFLISNYAKDILMPRDTPPAPLSFLATKAYAQGVTCADFDGNIAGCNSNAPQCRYVPECNKCRDATTPVSQQCVVSLKDKYAFGDIESLGKGINRIVRPAFSIAATAIVFYFIIAAFRIITAGENKDALGNAQKMITHGIVGFVLLMLSFLILRLFFDLLFGDNNLDPITPFGP